MPFTRLRVVPHMVRDRRSSRARLHRDLAVLDLHLHVVGQGAASARRACPWRRGCAPAARPARPAGPGPDTCRRATSHAAPSEHAAEHLAADIGGAGLVVAHHAARRGQDGDAEAVVELRQLLDLRIDAPARLGDAGDLLDGRLALGVLQLDVEAADAGAQLLDRARRGCSPRASAPRARWRAAGCAGATQRDCRARCALRMRVSMSPRGSDSDMRGPSSYQLALTMPGIWPVLASSRSMFRLSLNLR